MSWTDKKSVEVIKYLRDKFKINTLVETGTFKGINARLHSKNFKYVLTCEKILDYYKEARRNLSKCDNVTMLWQDSAEFLSELPRDKYIFYLDAHFYDPELPKGKGKFVVLRELESMEKFKRSIIIIHDFCNGLGGIKYDGIELDMDLLRKPLLNINPNFYFYTNKLESCEIVKPDPKSARKAGLKADKDTLSNLEYAWKTPRLTYRGILYCLPKRLTKKEMDQLGLRRWN